MICFWRYLCSWRRARSLSGIRVVLYTRGNCPLCDRAKAFLQQERSRLGFELAEVDIAGDADLTRLYGNWIPVVMVAGKVRFRGSIQPVLWQRLVRALSRGIDEDEQPQV